jgi:hypothetical protein
MTSFTKDITVGKEKSPFELLPVELKLQIFEHLSPISSTCLGLTCKAFYGIHWDRHGKVPLIEGRPMLPHWPDQRFFRWEPFALDVLPDLLRQWMGPDYIYKSFMSDGWMGMILSSSYYPAQILHLLHGNHKWFGGRFLKKARFQKLFPELLEQLDGPHGTPLHRVPELSYRFSRDNEFEMWSNEYMHWEQARRLLVKIIHKQTGYKREVWDGVRMYFTKLVSDSETSLR